MLPFKTTTKQLADKYLDKQIACLNYNTVCYSAPLKFNTL
jgi:hypothetical protein